jgi:hypothetical protein
MKTYGGGITGRASVDFPGVLRQCALDKMAWEYGLALGLP